MPDHRRRIVLLGIGHTNADFVLRWVKQPLPDIELVGVTRFERSTYSGLFPRALSGRIGRRDMEIDLPRLFEAAKGQLITGEVVGMESVGGQSFLQFSDRAPLPFDVLSVGVGSMPIGSQQFNDASSVVAVKPMQACLDRLQSCLQKGIASDSSPVTIRIVGGGVASVEIALCLQQSLADSGFDDYKISIVTSAGRVAGGMSARSIAKVERVLLKRGIDVRRNTRVDGVEGRSLLVSQGEKLAADVIVWATGAAPPPVIASLGLETDNAGFIATKKTLQSTSHSNVFAVGDCGTIIESPSPKAGVYAVRQCPILWENVHALLFGQELTEFRPQKNFLKLVNTGDGRALLEYGHLVIHSRACLFLKDRIDKLFIRKFQLNRTR